MPPVAARELWDRNAQEAILGSAPPTDIDGAAATLSELSKLGCNAYGGKVFGEIDEAEEEY